MNSIVRRFGFYCAAIVAVTAAVSARAAGPSDSIEVRVRLGYHIGGTAPVGMPASIRSLSKYSLTPSVQMALDAHKPLTGRWGLDAGIAVENKAMNIDARVKSYHMALTQSDETLEGVFTGQVVTKVRQWMVTLSLLATYDVSKSVRLKAGPYVSYVVDGGFSGYAYDGYLRVGDPTGTKVELGNDEASRGTYDFSGDLRHMQTGIKGGVDWQFCSRFGAYAELSWGITGIFHSRFDTIEQTLYPIYGTIGVSYTL